MLHAPILLQSTLDISTTKYSRFNYPGDEDSGAMSSWYVFSQLGFFPVAGQDVYLIILGL